MEIDKSNKMIQKGKELLESISNNNSIDAEVFNSRVKELKKIIKTNHELAKEVGALLQKLFAAKKFHEVKLDLIQVPVLQGYLSIGHRPKLKAIPLLKKEGITHILTLLSKKEGVEKIRESIRKWKLEWIWHPMENADPPSPDQYKRYIQLFKKLHEILAAKGSIYIHCSAGIHRTGMITFALLLYLGFNEPEAKQVLVNLRNVTRENMGVERVEWGKNLLRYKENQKFK